jgi:hypothetical protein
MEKIQIKCTSCGQKFAVAESYIGKMVECGSCDEKFKVEGAALIKHRKHYPGEKSESNTEMYVKSPAIEFSKNQDVAFKTPNYKNVSAEYAHPPKPIKTVIICIGVISISIFILLFLIGGREGGILKGLDDTKRLILAGFIALAGSGLIIAGLRNKIKGLILSLVLGGTLLVMPFIFPEVIEAKLADKPIVEIDLAPSIDDSVQKITFIEELEKYKRNIGFRKVAASRMALDDPDSLKAIVLRRSKVHHLDIILPYLQYNLEFESQPVTYLYGREVNGKQVILVTFISKKPLERVFELTKKH